MAKTNKVKKVMHEYKHGKLHSGSKKGPKVTSRKQAVAIAMSEQRQEKKACDNRYLNKLAEIVENLIQKDTDKNIKSAPKANEKFFTRQKMRGC